MSTHASPGAAVGTIVLAAIVGFAGGAIAGNTAGDGGRQAATPPATAPADTTASPSGTESPAGKISFASEQTSVGPGEQIDFTGALNPAVGGIELRVERKIGDGDFETFPDGDDPVTVTTGDDGSFSTFVLSNREGATVWRVVGTVEGVFLSSDEVAVTIG